MNGACVLPAKRRHADQCWMKNSYWFIRYSMRSATGKSSKRPRGSGKPSQPSCAPRMCVRRCVGCEKKTPQGVVNPLPARSSARAMKAVVQPTFSPSGA